MVGITIFGTINDADAQRARNSQTASINQQTATSSGDQTGLVNVGNVQAQIGAVVQAQCVLAGC
jgi:hypothetical protein